MSAHSRAQLPAEETPILGFGSYHRQKKTTSQPLSRPVRHAYSFFDGFEWLGLVLGFLTVAIAISSVQGATWLPSKPPLVWILFLAVISTAVLLKLKLSKAFKVPAFIVFGGLAVAWQGVNASGDQSLFSALAAPLNEGTIYFALFIVAVTWLFGMVTAWSVLRKNNAWIPSALGAALLLINVSNLPPQQTRVLPLYFGVVLVFAGINAMLNQRTSLRSSRGRASAGTLKTHVTAVLGIAALATIASVAIPTAGIERVGVDASGQFMNGLQKQWFNIFAGVPGKWTIIRSGDLKTLLFSAPIDNRDTPLFVVTADQPAYWRVNRYDSYSSWGWTSSVSPERDQDAVTDGPALPNLATTRFTYSVETRSKTDVILLTGEIVESSIPVRLETYAIPGTTTPDSDVLSVTTPELMPPYHRYTQTVSISSATPAQLIAAGTAYPAWVKSRYLDLPTSFSPRIRQLTNSLTRTSASPYENALSVQSYLRTLKYNIDAKSPSRDGDEVASFLFTHKEGVCTDFATAMVIMVRSIGIPSRLATGYLSGLHESGTDTYTVRAKDYHAWPEVYFPAYGWVGFDPTPRGENAEDLPLTGPTGVAEPPPEEFFFPDAGQSPGGASGIPSTPKRNIALPIIVAVLLGSSLLGLAWTFGRRIYANLRSSASANSVYAKMCRFAAMLGMGPAASETPSEYTNRLAASLPEGAEYVNGIAELYVQTSFSQRKELGDEQLAKLAAYWTKLYPILFKRRLPWNQR